MSADQHQPSSDIEEAVISPLVEHADGIYFDLAEDTYHADPALGSSDMSKLYEEPARYWFESRYNEFREYDGTTPARVRGTAVHCFLLYGREAFEERYAPLHLKGNTKAGMAERREVEESGKTGLRWHEYARIMQSGTILRNDPYLKVAFEGGRSEVAVFWTHESVPKKARFDYLKLRATVDLKSMTPYRRFRGFAGECADAVARWNYPLQAAHYCDGRAALRGLVNEGRVHGDHDTAWLREVAANEEWAWVWVFWQASGPPLTGSLSLTPGSPILEAAQRMLETAEARFRSYREQFGMTVPWIRQESTRELDITEMPAWWGMGQQ